MSGEMMLAEMREQPAVLDRLVARWDEIYPVLAAAVPSALAGTTFVARGSSDNAAVVGRYLVEMATHRPAALAAPSITTRYRVAVDYRDWLVIALSQSGATPEVVAVANEMRANGAVTVGVTNEPGCPLRDAVDVLINCDAGAERAIPATKTVTAQMTVMAMLAAAIGTVTYGRSDLAGLAPAVSGVLADTTAFRAAAGRWRDADRLFVVGRGVLYAAALETALKVKETTGVLAEGLSAADLLHGPVAAVGAGVPVLLLDGGGPATADIDEVASLLVSRQADVLRVSPGPLADVALPPGLPEPLQPITATVRGQQLAYAMSEARGADPDHPLGLSKVTATY